ncbi:hypothetical protein [Ciceribacter thiooxidans]|uniref:Uncharacterized protein n=1 Tax=Ciceribacter thiooxidans TaxID=1969821 RepID=A0ABV7I4G9_9HYPH|nr:hypothetical protein [Ciceribacter thiooxidans]
MNNQIKLLGVNIQRAPAWDRSFAIMAFGDVAIEPMAMTLRGCALVRLNGNIVALPPKVPGAKPGDLGAIQWDARSEFAQAVRDKMLAGYEALGGQMPPDPTKKQTNGMNAARRYAEKVKATTDEPANDNEAVAGLHRTLGIETEEAYRACG